MKAKKKPASQSRPKTDGTKRRVSRTAFKPGQSGNPGGRPKKDVRLRELEELAREHSDEAFACLLDVAKNAQSDSARVAAAVAILDRGWGRPVERTEIDASGTITHEHRQVRTVDEIFARILGPGGMSKDVPVVRAERPVLFAAVSSKSAGH